MDTIGRKAFWDELYRIRDNTPERLQALLATIKTPKKLCRFRSVSENSLLQLQENKLYCSSADYYDDPFDTFIHFDYVTYYWMDEMKAFYAAMVPPRDGRGVDGGADRPCGDIEPKQEEHNRAKLSEPGYSMRQTKAAVGIFLPQPLLFFEKRESADSRTAGWMLPPQ